MRNGIAVKINVSSKNGFDIVKNKEIVLKELNNVIDTSCYDINEYKNSIELVIKDNIFKLQNKLNYKEKDNYENEIINDSNLRKSISIKIHFIIFIMDPNDTVKLLNNTIKNKIDNPIFRTMFFDMKD